MKHKAGVHKNIAPYATCYELHVNWSQGEM